MSQTFVLIDTHNLFHRAKHVVRGDIDSRVGMSLHIILNSLRMVMREFNGSHAVFCLESSSWRKKVSDTYKRNRAFAQAQKSQKEIEDDNILLEALNSFTEYVSTKTNATVLKAPGAEADDLIAVWIKNHPEDKHIILSSDADYYQLLSSNVEIYNGITDQHITINGVFDKKGKPIECEKVLSPFGTIDTDWFLFEKCVRGDKSDNIMAAAPGARMKGSKNKIGIVEAFEDRNTKGFTWNNFMNQKVVDVDGVEQTVKERFEMNRLLIDLRDLPAEVVSNCTDAIAELTNRAPVPGIGIHFLKFCSKWRLDQIAKYPDEYSAILNKKYVKSNQSCAA